ncbi:hypothetical protein, partial [Streptomyces varsoviensis]|uniref:hypothetical protein n=1 Tax=Streptomyces varsoviensis TaxID=67373 RepID=UPI001B804D8C
IREAVTRARELGPPDPLAHGPDGDAFAGRLRGLGAGGLVPTGSPYVAQAGDTPTGPAGLVGRRRP